MVNTCIYSSDAYSKIIANIEKIRYFEIKKLLIKKIIKKYNR